MKNVFLYVWLFCATTICSYGQFLPYLQNNNWVFGTQNSLRFIDAPATSSVPVFGYSPAVVPNYMQVPTSLNYPNSYAYEGCASVSDRLGNLSFVTNGKFIYTFNSANANPYTLVSGVTLRGELSSMQNVIIIPKPNFNKRFYIVTIIGSTIPISGNSGSQAFQRSKGLYFSEIDLERPPGQMMISLNTPLTDINGTAITGDTTFNPRINYNKSEGLTATLHNDGQNYWLIANINATHFPSNTDVNSVMSFLVTENGIGPASSETIYPQSAPATNITFCIKISPDNQRIALVTSEDGIYTGSFDSTTGAVSFTNHISRPNGVFKTYGAEFSSNSNYLYYGAQWQSQNLALPEEKYLARLNMTTNTSVTLPLDKPIVGIQRGIDNNIYLSGGTSTLNNLLFINDPDNITNTNQITYSTKSMLINLNEGLPQWVWKQPCEFSLVDDEDIPATYLVQEQRTSWIQCVNQVTANATGIYHAGNFIELLPENGTNLGFEAQAGSEFTAYIASCGTGFVYRNSNSESNPNQANEKASVLAESSELQIYPNPSNTFVNIDLRDSKLKSIVITSLDGKMILNRNVNTNSEQIDVSYYSKGLYLITVQTDDGQTIIKKFIKN